MTSRVRILGLSLGLVMGTAGITPALAYPSGSAKRSPELFFAIGQGDVKAVRGLLAGGTDANSENTLGMSALTAGEGPATGDLLRDAAVKETLSAREREVIQLLVGGATNASIARRLFISESTAKAHVHHILKKLGAANRAEAVAKFLRGPVS